MNQIMQRIFKNKKVDFGKLLPYGFLQSEGNYTYHTMLLEEMELFVTIDCAGEITAEVIDREFGEPFTLFLTEGAEGEFVGSVREKYEEALTEIAEKCFVTEIFQSASAKAVIAYIQEKYGDELEFLWEDLDAAIWRRKDNQKWYALIMQVSKRKLKLPSDEVAEIIDLRMESELLDALADGKKYFRGYHMNKKHWVTLLLDGTVPQEEIKKLIDESYRLAKKGK